MTGHELRQTPSQLKVAMTAAWDRGATSYDGHWGHGLQTTVEHDAWLALLDRPIPPSPKLRLLDVGCGTGFFALLACELGHDVTGIDLSNEMLSVVRAKAEQAGYQATFVMGDAEAPPDLGSFDVAMARHVLRRAWQRPRSQAMTRSRCSPGRRVRPFLSYQVRILATYPVTGGGEGSIPRVTGPVPKPPFRLVATAALAAVSLLALARAPLGPSALMTFTATAVLQLVDQHKLSLDSPLSKWEPQVQHSSQITVKMLLSMTSGIFDEGGSGSTLSQEAVAHPGRAFTPQGIVNMAIAQGPHSPPGRASRTTPTPTT